MSEPPILIQAILISLFVLVILRIVFMNKIEKESQADKELEEEFGWLFNLSNEIIRSPLVWATVSTDVPRDHRISQKTVYIAMPGKGVCLRLRYYNNFTKDDTLRPLILLKYTNISSEDNKESISNKKEKDFKECDFEEKELVAVLSAIQTRLQKVNSNRNDSATLKDLFKGPGDE